jgi:hypothetical protein
MPNESSRLAFFKKHIYKVIYRTHNGCDCHPCAKNYEDGIIVRNIAHAEYLAEVEDAGECRYFATKEERDTFVREGSAVLQ